MDLDCLACGGVLVTLGSLGQLHWFRCRDCGLDQSIPAERLDWEESMPDDEKRESIHVPKEARV